MTTGVGQAERSATAVILLLLTGLALLSAMGPIYNGDLGWHLALGRTIEQSGQIPKAEPYTYTAPGAPMVAHQWLSQRAYWEIAQHTGVYGLRWTNGLLAALLVPLTYLLFRSGTRSRALALFGCLLFLLLARSRFQLRPHMLNHVFGIGLYLALFVARPRLSAPQIAGFAAATALWANLHSGAAILPAMLGVHGIVGALETRFRGERPVGPQQPTHSTRRRELGDGNPVRVLALAGACTAGLFATPNHLRLLPYMLESGRINRTLSWEWLSITHYVTHPSGDLLMISAWALLALATLACLAAAWRRHESLATPAVALFTILLPLQSVRFSWLAFPAIACVIDALSRWHAGNERARPQWRWGGLVAVLAVGAIALFVLPPRGGFGSAAQLLSPRFGFSPNHFPLGGARVLSEAQPPGRLFAQSEWGGFITFALEERYPIFSDGRWVTIGEDIVRQGHAIARRRPRALELLDGWEVDLALFERGWMRDDDPALDAWMPVYEGFNSAIYVRRGEGGAPQREAFARYYAEHGVAFDMERGFDAQRAALSNPDWARQHSVRRRYVQHFTPDGRHTLGGRILEGWPREAAAH